MQKSIYIFYFILAKQTVEEEKNYIIKCSRKKSARTTIE